MAIVSTGRHGPRLGLWEEGGTDGRSEPPEKAGAWDKGWPGCGVPGGQGQGVTADPTQDPCAGGWLPPLFSPVSLGGAELGPGAGKGRRC